MKTTIKISALFLLIAGTACSSIHEIVMNENFVSYSEVQELLREARTEPLHISKDATIRLNYMVMPEMFGVTITSTSIAIETKGA